MLQTHRLAAAMESLFELHVLFATYKQYITLYLLAMQKLCYMDFISITSSVWALGKGMWRYSRNQIKMN